MANRFPAMRALRAPAHYTTLQPLACRQYSTKSNNVRFLSTPKNKSTSSCLVVPTHLWFSPREERRTIQQLCARSFSKAAESKPAPAGVPYSKLTIGFVKETYPGEKRTAISVENVLLLKKEGFSRILVEKGSGAAAMMSDDEYVKAGAEIVDSNTALGADVVLKLRPPTLAEVEKLKPGATICSFIYENSAKEVVDKLASKGCTVFAMDRMPRTISKAQAFDAMTSQLGIMGYKAVIEAAHVFGRPLGGKMTMAGKIPPAKVLVVGAAVAGLEAIATAKNMGAQVFATDTRPESKEQIIAAGGKMLEPAVASESGVGGYAKEQGDAYRKAAEDMYKRYVKDMDIIITTALIPGRPAPRIITKEMISSMKAGSVTVDLASEQGGNVETTVPGQLTTTDNGVLCVGYTDLPSRQATQASKLYSNNVVKFFLYLNDGSSGHYAVNLADDVARCSILLDKGTYMPLKLGPPPAPPVKEQTAADLKPAVNPKKAEISRITKTSVAVSLLVAAAVGGPATFTGGLTTFALATIVGYYVVWGVTHALHSPLMSVTNAISGLVVVGGMMLAGGTILPGSSSQILAAVAIALASINIVGGFRITQRMLDMFKRPTDPPEYFRFWALPAAAVGAVLIAGHMSGVAHMYEIGYLLSSLFCVGSLAGLSSQETSRLGCTLGMVGVGWGILSAGLFLTNSLAFPVFMQMAACASVGGVVGLYIANKIDPMDLPQLVAAFHSLVGLAAVLVCIASHIHELPHLVAAVAGPMLPIQLSAIYWGAVIGGITFTGSIVAFLKLNGSLRSGALSYPGRLQVNMAMGAAAVGGFYMYFTAPAMAPLLGITALSFVAGWHLVDAVGGADMPVCVTVLNSYSGWALVAEGFLMDNTVLTAVGCLIGSSGAILTYIMCVAMNRSIFNVLFGSYAAAGPEAIIDGVHQETSVAETVSLLTGASSVVIVPGFGLCQARAQYAVAEIVEILRKHGVTVRFGIHPVAGRMPGQLNVLLAEAGVDYDVVLEMDEINPDLPETDVCLVIGANDVVNPGALEDPNSALAGMPVLHVWKAKTCIVMKRSMATGYAGVQNPLFFKSNNYMLFGNAKDVVEKLRDGCREAIAQ